MSSSIKIQLYQKKYKIWNISATEKQLDLDAHNDATTVMNIFDYASQNQQALTWSSSNSTYVAAIAEQILSLVGFFSQFAKGIQHETRDNIEEEYPHPDKESQVVKSSFPVNRSIPYRNLS